MKKKFIFPKFSIVSFIIGIVLIGFRHTVNKLEYMNYCFCFGTINIKMIDFIILCVGVALLLSSIIWLMFKNIKRKWIPIPITAILALCTVWYLVLTFWSSNVIDTDLAEFTSPDGRHNIIVMETSHLHGGSGHVFEKTSNLTMKKIGDYSFNHVFNPVTKGEFNFEWSENYLELHYKGKGSGEYDILKMEYIK